MHQPVTATVFAGSWSPPANSVTPTRQACLQVIQTNAWRAATHSSSSRNSSSNCTSSERWLGPGSLARRRVITHAAKGVKTRYACKHCGHLHRFWTAHCDSCGLFADVTEVQMMPQAKESAGAGVATLNNVKQAVLAPGQKPVLAEAPTGRGWLSSGGAAANWSAYNGLTAQPRSLTDPSRTKGQQARLKLGGQTGGELNRVLGGGVVTGSLVLVGGDPGVGKSTLMLQVAAYLSTHEAGQPQPAPLQGREATGAAASALPQVLYVSGEEMEDQIIERACRMGLQHCDQLFLLSEARLDVVAHLAMQLRPRALVLDSINTCYLPDVPHSPGNVTQIKECGQLLMRLAKQEGITVFIIGHVTKSGDVAGPNTLAHMVDTVLYLEGEGLQANRMLRATKNRYGPTDEVGVFVMDAAGLHAVDNPSRLFLSDRFDDGSSSVVAVTMAGNRPLAGEVQALCSKQPESAQGPPVRMSTGVDKARCLMLLEVLNKHSTGVRLYNQHVYVNVVGGLQMKEVAADLAIVIAVASSYYGAHVPAGFAAVGEVDLNGRVRASFRSLEQRLFELANMGLRTAIIPPVDGWQALARDPRLRGMTLTAVGSVQEALLVALGDVALRPPPRKGSRQRSDDWEDEEVD